MNKKKVATTALAVGLAAALALGGTWAYYQDSSEKVTNTILPNYNSVTLDETDSEDPSEKTTSNIYEIVPGTTDTKDPVATVNYTLDSYVYLVVDDATAELIDFSIDTSVWTQLDGYDDVWYALVTADDTCADSSAKASTSAGESDVIVYTKALKVLTGDTISYDSGITNEDMFVKDSGGNIVYDADGNPTLIDDLTLSFRAYIVQATLTDTDDYDADGHADPETAFYLTYYAAAVEDDPTNVAAIGLELYSSVEEALLDLEEGGTMTLLANTTVSTGIGATDEVPTEYTIDLNGNTLSLAAALQISAVENTYVTESNFYEIFGIVYTDEYSDWLGYLAGYENVATDATIKNGTIEVAGSSGYIRYEAGTTLTLENVTFTNTSGSTNAQKAIQYNVSDSTATNTMTVTGCTFDNTCISMTGSSGDSYELTANFTDCDFTATLGNGGACVSFNHYIYGNITFTDCDFDVIANGNSTSGIYFQATDSNIDSNTVDLTLNNVTFTGTSQSTYFSTYTPVLVGMRDKSVVDVTDNKASAYSYLTDGSPVTYDGNAVTVTAVNSVENLATAISSAESGSAIELSDGTYELTSSLTISKDITLKGSDSTVITGAGTIYVSGNCSASFENITFTDVDVSSDRGSFVYYTGAQGKLVFEECSFINTQWDSMQITVAKGTKDVEICVTDCVFDTTSDAEGHDHNNDGKIDESEAGTVHRYIHIEDYNVGTSNTKLTITGCTFNNCDKCDDDGLTIYGIPLENIYVGNNTTDDEDAFAGELWITADNKTLYSAADGNLDAVLEAFLGTTVTTLADAVE